MSADGEIAHATSHRECVSMLRLTNAVVGVQITARHFPNSGGMENTMIEPVSNPVKVVDPNTPLIEPHDGSKLTSSPPPPPVLPPSNTPLDPKSGTPNAR